MKRMLITLPLMLSACTQSDADPTTPAFTEPEAQQSWTRTDSPCEDSDEERMTVEDGDTWCGCGEQPGLFVMGEGSATFEAVAGTEALQIEAMTMHDGKLYLAGLGDELLPGQVAFVLDTESGSVEVLFDLSVDLDLSADAFVASDIAVDGDTVVLTDASSGELAILADGSWTTTADWSAETDAAIDAMVATGDGLAATGSSASSEAMVYLEADGESSVSFDDIDLSGSMDATADVDASAWSQAWFTVGEAGSDAMLSVCLEDCTSAEAWTPIDLASEVEGAMAATDVSFSASGDFGVIVGATTASEGFALVTADGGATWTELSGSLDSLESCAVDDDGHYTLAGEAGFFAEGTIEA